MKAILLGILLIMALFLGLGMIGEKGAANKRTYCYGFIACLVAIAVIEAVSKLG